MSLGSACKAIVLPLVALSDHTKQGSVKGLQYGGDQATDTIAYLTNLALIIGAAYLAWRCNAGESLPMQILYTVLAGLFSGLYLIYYLIYHILMGKACGVLV